MRGRAALATVLRRLGLRRGRSGPSVPPSQGADWLERIDVTRHNRGGTSPTFDPLVSQVVSAAQFEHPTYLEWQRRLFPDEAGTLHRKLWEHCYILRAAEQSGVLRPGNRAIGFGVGSEPIPAALAREGLHVLATDLHPQADLASPWAATGQHMQSLEALRFPHLIDDADLERLVRTAWIDMTDLPGDLGTFHVVWSSGSFEHLGSPEAGIEFVLSTIDLLEPGGLTVHTTELELVPHDGTRDYGHLALYRPEDLDGLVERIRARGLEIESNWTVCLDTPADRVVAVAPDYDPIHLKLAVGQSVTTSVGIIARKPAGRQ